MMTAMKTECQAALKSTSCTSAFNERIPSIWVGAWSFCTLFLLGPHVSTKLFEVLKEGGSRFLGDESCPILHLEMILYFLYLPMESSLQAELGFRHL